MVVGVVFRCIRVLVCAAFAGGCCSVGESVCDVSKPVGVRRGCCVVMSGPVSNAKSKRPTLRKFLSSEQGVVPSSPPFLLMVSLSFYGVERGYDHKTAMSVSSFAVRPANTGLAMP